MKKRRGRPPGGTGFLVYLPDDADAWVRAKAVALDVPPGHVVELGIRRMMTEDVSKPETQTKKTTSTGEKIVRLP